MVDTSPVDTIVNEAVMQHKDWEAVIECGTIGIISFI